MCTVTSGLVLVGLTVVLHKDAHVSTSDHGADAQVAQRVWWSLFTLDWLCPQISISLLQQKASEHSEIHKLPEEET